MVSYIKVAGDWKSTTRPYLKKNNTWVPAQYLYVKRSGVWEEAYRFDHIPPDPPELTLQIVRNRFVRVGVRLPGLAHDPELKQIRVLAARKDGVLTGPLGAGYIQGNDADFPHEDWSNFYYNSGNPNGNYNHGDSFDYDYKEYPLNPTTNTDLPGGQFYYFAAWSRDFDENWSIGVFNQIWMPKNGVDADAIVVKEANFQVNQSGSLNLDGVAFTPGDLVARDSPRSNGIWYHANKITSSVGYSGKATIRAAQIRITRSGDDIGPSTTNVNLFWHGQQSSADLPFADFNGATKVGTLNKGETDWFPIPTAWYPLLSTQIKGFGLRFGTDPNDQMMADGISTHLRSGELHVIWEEAL